MAMAAVGAYVSVCVFARGDCPWEEDGGVLCGLQSWRVRRGWKAPVFGSEPRPGCACCVGLGNSKRKSGTGPQSNSHGVEREGRRRWWQVSQDLSAGAAGAATDCLWALGALG
jgi:hypothetical protein